MTTRIRTFLFSAGAIALVSPVLPAGEAEEIFNPASHHVQRYQHIWEKSPFVTEAPAVQETGGLSQRFALTGVATLRDQPVIFVLDRSSLSRLVLTTTPNPQGLALVSVDSPSDPKQSRAIIRLGTEQGVIRYDLAALQSVNPSSENPQPTTPALGQAPDPTSPVPRPTKVITRKKITLTN